MKKLPPHLRHEAEKVEHYGFVCLAAVEVVGIHSGVWYVSVILLVSGAIAWLFPYAE